MELNIPSSSFSSLKYGSTTKDLAVSIFFRLIGGMTLDPTAGEAIKFGMAKEGEVIDMLTSRGLDVVQTSSRNKKYKDLVLSATPDLIENHGCIDQSLIEIKNPYYLRIISEEERNADVFSELRYTATLKEYYSTYELQCQIQMYVFGCHTSKFVVNSENKLHIMDLEYDESVLEKNYPIFKEIWVHLALIFNQFESFDETHRAAEVLVFLKKQMDKQEAIFKLLSDDFRKKHLAEGNSVTFTTKSGTLNLKKTKISVKY